MSRLTFGLRLLALSLLLAGYGCASDPSVPDAGVTPVDAGGDTTTADAGVLGAPSGGTFRLAWQDEFDSFDGARWALQTHTFDGNLATFSTENATFANGIATLSLTSEATDTMKPYRGVEMRSVDTLTYGKVESRIRFAKGSGVVSSLVLIYTPWPADDWNELDIEYLGRYSDRAQFNVMVYTGAPTTPPVSKSVSPTQFPENGTFDFDPTADFHVYAIEWTPTQVRFLVDDVVKRSWSKMIDRLKLPQNILLTIWASSSASWAGPVQAGTAPTSAEYDWIKVYDWVPDPK